MTRGKKVNISDCELEIMKALWERSPQSFPEIVLNVQKNNSWEGVTIKTMLTRLFKKGAVKQEGIRRLYRYSPLVSREDYLEQASENFLTKTFAGAPGAMLSFFVRKGKISGEDIAELQQQLAEMESDLHE